MFRVMNNLLEDTPYSDQSGCVGITYNFIPHKSTTFGNFLSSKKYISF